MHQIDASSIVFAWDTYPLKQFPNLWDWIYSQFEEESLFICLAAFDEVGHVAPDCHQWLKEQSVHTLPIGNEILTRAMELKNTLGIQEDLYHPDGVDENDLFIIASAETKHHILISNEAKQPTLPQNLRRFKIPAVCNLVKQPCVNFTERIKAENTVFG